MKKATLFAFACALFVGVQAANAQEAAQELTYQPDPSQGVLLNRMKDNWFITVEGGASFYVAPLGVHRDAADRFMPAASIYGGKWFSPVFGGRFGVNYLGLKVLPPTAAISAPSPTPTATTTRPSMPKSVRSSTL